jgi:Tfp pilus assembly protein PilN
MNESGELPHHSVEIKHKKSSRLAWAIFLFGIVILVAIFFHVMIYIKKQNIENMKAEMKQNREQIASMLSGDIKTVMDAKQAADSLTQQNIVWSQLLNDLASTLPSTVSIVTLTGDNKGKITANLSTTNMADVSRTIELLLASQQFKDVFVPSLTSGISQDQQMVVHFPIVLDYSKMATSPLPVVLNGNTNS